MFVSLRVYNRARTPPKLRRGAVVGIIKASSLEQAEQLLKSGEPIKIELDFELDSDAFFNFAMEYCTNGTKLTRNNDRFVVSRKKVVS